MKIVHSKTENVDVLTLSGRIDATTAPDFETRLLQVAEIVDVGLILDFSNVDYVSSAGLRVLLVALRKLNGLNKKLVVSGPSDNVEEVITLTGFHKLIKINNSMEEAFETLLATG